MEFRINNGELKEYIGDEKTLDVVIPEGVTSIGNSAFLGCEYIRSVIIPEGVTSIGDMAFMKCENLVSVTIPESVTKIGFAAFWKCINLSDVNIPKNVIQIGEWVFAGCKKFLSKDGYLIVNGTLYGYMGKGKNIVIPNDVTSIANSVFWGCGKIKSITIPEGVTSIGDMAFMGCKNLKNITIPESILSIGSMAFVFCEHLRNITIPKGVTSIGDGVFAECKRLKSVIVSENLSISEKTFDGCEPLLLISENDNHEQRFYAISSNDEENDNYSEYINQSNWQAYDDELIENGPEYKYCLIARLLGGLDRLLHPVDLTEDNKIKYIKLLKKNVRKMKAFAQKNNYPMVIKALKDLGIIA